MLKPQNDQHQSDRLLARIIHHADLTYHDTYHFYPFGHASGWRLMGAGTARFAEAELERLRREVSLVLLIESTGITLARPGEDYAARCPFHDEDTASLIVTPE